MPPRSKIIKLNPREKAPLKLPSKDDRLGMAKYLEQTGKTKEAVQLYEKLIKAERFREFTYNRLMMIYRKNKDYKNELRIINAGIKTFQDLYMPTATGRHSAIISLSKKLNVLIGLTDKKGRNLSDMEPIAKWKKRRLVVLQKMKAGN